MTMEMTNMMTDAESWKNEKLESITSGKIYKATSEVGGFVAAAVVTKAVGTIIADAFGPKKVIGKVGVLVANAALGFFISSKMEEMWEGYQYAAVDTALSVCAAVKTAFNAKK